MEKIHNFNLLNIVVIFSPVLWYHKSDQAESQITTLAGAVWVSRDPFAFPLFCIPILFGRCLYWFFDPPFYSGRVKIYALLLIYPFGFILLTVPPFIGVISRICWSTNSFCSRRRFFLIICNKRRHIKMAFIGNCQIVLFCIVLVFRPTYNLQCYI